DSLRRPAAPAGGLRAELEALAEELRAVGPARVDVRVVGTADVLLAPREIQEVLHVAREAASNALWHGRPSTLTLHATGTRRTFVLMVRDDGAGFVPHAVGPAAGQGLANMASRAARLGGTLQLESAP